LTPEQATALVGAVAALTTAVAGLIGAVVALYAKVEQNKKALDGRVDDLVAMSRVAGHAEGVVLAHQLANPPADDDLDTT
jgi:hypothetical protein